MLPALAWICCPDAQCNAPWTSKGGCLTMRTWALDNCTEQSGTATRRTEVVRLNDTAATFFDYNAAPCSGPANVSSQPLDVCTKSPPSPHPSTNIYSVMRRVEVKEDCSPEGLDCGGDEDCCPGHFCDFSVYPICTKSTDKHTNVCT